MKFIQTVKDKTPTRSVKYRLHSALSGPEKARSIKIVHASVVSDPSMDFCGREFALMDFTGMKPKDKFLTTSERVTYKIGRDLEKFVVEVLADEGVAWGDWQCTHCMRVQKRGLRPHHCDDCACKEFRYREVRFKSEESGISCGVDVFLDLGDGMLKTVEIKSIDKEKFKGLKAPLAEHRYRLSLYLRIIAESESPFKDRIELDEGTVLYVSKGGYGNVDMQPRKWGIKDGRFSPFKEFRVKRNDPETEMKVERARELLRYRETKEKFPKRICPTSIHSRTKKCGMVSVCFSGGMGDQ